MVTAELFHNPYLLQTKVKFNGQDPRINCQIEKYDTLPLKDWVHLVPSIFYNEMNGYDFDLYFIGTKSDFHEVCEAFKNANISEESVHVIYKNELESADDKSKEVDSIIDWLKQNRNRKFDFESFWVENSEFFEGTYPYIIIGGNMASEIDGVSSESIEKSSELSSVSLTNTPILFVITGENLKASRQNLVNLIKRKDVRQDQLFFLIHPSLDAEKITRTIVDLGVSSPQIVFSLEDEAVIKYFQNYPVTDYVRESIKLFRTISNNISKTLNEENQLSITTNAGIHKTINDLESKIAQLKIADEKLIEHDIFSPSPSFSDKLTNLEEQLMKWKNHKVKITGDLEAKNAAIDFTSYIYRQVSSFIIGVRDNNTEELAKINSRFYNIYQTAGDPHPFVPSLSPPPTIPPITVPNIESEFLKMKETSVVEGKAGFLGIMQRKNNENNGRAEVTTYFLDQWRLTAKKAVMELASEYISQTITSLSNYYNSLAESYHERVQSVIATETQEKDRVSMQLSDDERKLQEDNYWLMAFKEQIDHLERG